MAPDDFQADDGPAQEDALTSALVLNQNVPKKKGNGSADEPDPTLARSDADDAEDDGTEAEDVSEEETEAETDDEADEGDADDAQSDDEEDEDADEEEQLVTVKVNGKTERVTLDEVVRGYQREADYTRKTNELAQQRKAVEQQETEIRERAARYSQGLEAVEKFLEGASLQEPDWDKLKAEDPEGFAIRYAEFDQQKRAHQEKLSAVKAERERVEKQAQEERQRQFEEYKQRERDALLTKIPEWHDPKKAQTDLQKLSSYLKEQGFADEELQHAVDHRMYVLMRKAMWWDQLDTSRKQTTQKVREAPKMAAPGARKRPADRKTAEKKRARERFERTGDPEDAVALILNR